MDKLGIETKLLQKLQNVTVITLTSSIVILFSKDDSSNNQQPITARTAEFIRLLSFPVSFLCLNLALRGQTRIQADFGPNIPL